MSTAMTTTRGQAGKSMALADISALSGPEKVAVLCMALGPEGAVQLTQTLAPDEAETVSLQIAQMDQVNADIAEAVLAEWIAKVLEADAGVGGGVKYASAMLEKAFGPDKASATLKKIREQMADSAGVRRLRGADPQQLAMTLNDEHPQTIALVLANMDPHHTAAVLRELDPMLSSEVLYRIGRMEKVAPDMMFLIEKALSHETELTFTRGLQAAGGPSTVASVLNYMPGPLERELIDQLTARDSQLGERVKNLMFVFDDITRLDDKAIQRVLRETESKVLALALKNAKEELKTRLLAGMSQRAVSALKDEMSMLGPVRLREVEAAQAQIVAHVRTLEAAGEITISSGGEEDALVE